MSKLTTNYGFSMPDVDDYVPDTINALAKTIELIDSNINVISNKLSSALDSTDEIAIGRGASASGSGSIAIGGLAEASIDGEVVLGRYRIIPGYVTSNGSLEVGLSGETPVYLYCSYPEITSSNSKYINFWSCKFAYSSTLEIYDIKYDSTYSDFFDITKDTDKKIIKFTIKDSVKKELADGKINFMLRGFDITNCSFS